MENEHKVIFSDTVNYYEEHADDFVASTIHADVSSLYQKFEENIRPGCRILDLGCGSGRDSRYYSEKGYDVVAVDPSPAMCKRTKEYAGVPVYTEKAEELTFQNEFDAVWACASLLHVPRSKQTAAMQAICNSMRPGGILYCSWKYGDQDRMENGRAFTDLDEKGLEALLHGLPELRAIDVWISSDVRPEREQKWLNALIRKSK